MGLRRRRVFHLTARGASELKKWIMQPITPDHLTRGCEEIVLRFAFSENAAGVAASLALLRSLEAALKTRVASLRIEYQASRKLMPTSARLAFESGLRGSEHLLEWTQYAIAVYEKPARKKGSVS